MLIVENTSGNTHWRFLGNHQGEFVPDPDNPGNTVLKVTASGRAVMNHNHVETTFLGNAALAPLRLRLQQGADLQAHTLIQLSAPIEAALRISSCLLHCTAILSTSLTIVAGLVRCFNWHFV